MRLVDGVRRAMGFHPPGRDIRVRDDDVFLVSYPRSGNTWVRVIIDALRRQPVQHSYSALQESVPDIYKVDRRKIDRLPDRRVLKSHEPFDPRYPSVIYILRDPRAVAVSYFHYQRRAGLITADLQLDVFVDRFISGQVDGFGSWREHVLSWWSTRGTTDSFLLIRYEDLAADTLSQATRIAAMLGLVLPERDVEKAVEAASFDRMVSMERDHVSSPRAASDDKDITFLRQGAPHGWRSELSDRSASLIASNFADAMTLFGYGT